MQGIIWPNYVETLEYVKTLSIKSTITPPHKYGDTIEYTPEKILVLSLNSLWNGSDKTHRNINDQTIQCLKTFTIILKYMGYQFSNFRDFFNISPNQTKERRKHQPPNSTPNTSSKKTEKSVILTLEVDQPNLSTGLIGQIADLGLKPTLFISSDILMQPDKFTPNDTNGCKLDSTLSLLNKISELGWDIGSMGHEMADLTNLNHHQQMDALTHSYSLFSEILGLKPVVFLYPYGAYDAWTVSCLRHLGFRAGLTSIEAVGLQNPYDNFNLRRIFLRRSLIQNFLMLLKNIKLELFRNHETETRLIGSLN